MYLPDYGWEVTVVTVGNDSYYPRDASLDLKKLGRTRIRYANRFPLNQLRDRIGRHIFGKKQLLYSYLDTFYDWYPLAKSVAIDELTRMKYDAILATVPPYTSLRVARAISKKTGIPSIADLRDPFTQNRYIEMPSKFHRKYYENYEKNLLNSFNHITVAWPMIAHWNSKALGIDKDKFTVITNGYEPDDFKNRYNRPAPTSTFTMGYFGSIYGLRTVDPFFKVYGLALQTNPEFKEMSQVIFSGAFDRQMVRRTARKVRALDNLNILEYRSRRETLDWMSKCHALLLFTGMVTENYPGKLFDYIASNRPILNLSKPSPLTKLIGDLGIGANVDADKPEEAVNVLLDWFEKFKQGEKIIKPKPEDIKRFDGKILTGKMANILDSIAK